MTITDTRYEGLLDLIRGDSRGVADGSPPCEVFKASGEERCGRPSCKRIRIQCECGSRTELVFICRTCDEHGTHCYHCGSHDFTVSPA